MHRATLAPTLGALALLGACAPLPPGPVPGAPPTLPVTETCGAAALQSLVGRPASVLETIRFGGETRIIRPGMAVTMDYRPDRLNIEIDRSNRIARVFCS